MIVLTYIYALCLMGFGMFGYYKAGSIVSLVSSVIFGVILFSICIGNSKRWSQLTAPPVTLMLTILFAVRSYITQTPTAIGWTIASFILFALFTYRATKLAQDRKERGS
ncbi:MAG TPA: TMEM14 family protein [Chlamydiales bacterium]|nr:TMEM14 family protein [Chlamydiales bacterium]